MSKKKRKKAEQASAKFERKMLQAMIARNNNGIASGLAGMLPAGRNEQFLLGAAIGAAAAYVLGDEALRGKLMKSGIRMFSNLMGDFAEFKEQLADMQAEVEAEQQGVL